MRKMMFLTATFMIGLTILMTAVITVTNSEQERSFEKSDDVARMHLLGGNTEFTNSSEITEYDVRLMWEKVQLGIQVVDNFWQVKFAQSGRYTYQRPQVKYYTEPVYTACGKTYMNNAMYCAGDHTIYFDALFFTRLMKAVGEAQGTDGDMSVIFVLAHEWGHSSQRTIGILREISIFNERNADCSAGAFTRYAYQQGWLEKGDIEEATYTISNLGDDLPWHAKGAHGDGQSRLSEFVNGLDGGLVVCGGGFPQ